jgi:hypothetical protein
VITVTFSSNFDGGEPEKMMRAAFEKKVRAMIRERLTFPGSDKLKITVTANQGKATLAFDGPDEVTAEAKKRWIANARS